MNQTSGLVYHTAGLGIGSVTSAIPVPPNAESIRVYGSNIESEIIYLETRFNGVWYVHAYNTLDAIVGDNSSFSIHALAPFGDAIRFRSENGTVVNLIWEWLLRPDHGPDNPQRQ